MFIIKQHVDIIQTVIQNLKLKTSHARINKVINKRLTSFLTSMLSNNWGAYLGVWGYPNFSYQQNLVQKRGETTFNMVEMRRIELRSKEFQIRTSTCLANAFKSLTHSHYQKYASASPKSCWQPRAGLTTLFHC